MNLLKKLKASVLIKIVKWFLLMLLVFFFTSVPLDKVLCIISKNLLFDKSLSNCTKLAVDDVDDDDDVIECLKLCFDSTVFTYKNMLYRQVSRIPMGSCISPVVANIFMKDFEHYALTSFSSPPLIWIRYVDDTFRILNPDFFLTFLDHLNSICPSITFILEKKNLIAFLF